MRSTLTLLTCALLLVLPASLVAQPPGFGGGLFGGGAFGGGDFARGAGPQSDGARGDGPGHRGGPLGFLSGRVAEYLELTDEQITAAQQIKEDLHAQVQPLHEQAQSQRQELRALLDTDNPDATTVGQLVISSHAIHEQVRAAGAAAKAAFVALLTPEQLEKWEQLQEIRDNFGPGKGRFGGGPGGEGGPRHGGPGGRFGGFGG